MSKAHQQEHIVSTIHRAATIAQRHGHEFVTLEHLTASLMEEPDVQKCLAALNVDVQAITDTLNEFFASGIIPTSSATPSPTNGFDAVVMRCVGSSLFSPRPSPHPTDILVHLLQHPADDNHAVTLLTSMGLTALNVKRYISHSMGTGAPAKGPATNGEFGMDGMPQQQPQITNRADAEAFLEKYCVNLNEHAKSNKVDPLIGREDEVYSIIQITARRTKNNAVLVGEPGVGKTAIAEGLALKIVREEVPEAIKESIVYSLDVGNLVAGTRFRGDFEERMKQVLTALEFIPTAILFIDEIHTIMGAGAGSQGSLDIANLLKPALAKGSLRCIGSTTLEEFRKHFEKDRALLRRFKRVDVKEPSTEDTKLILRGLRPVYEEFHGISFSDEAIDAAVDLSVRYITNSFLPDKAIDVIDNAGSRQRIRPEGERLKVLGVPEIEFEVSKIAHIPATEVKEDEKEKIKRLEPDLLSAVHGQEPAVKALIDAFLVARAGLREVNKPMGSYLFTGPTGVGKTEVARQLAKTMGVPLLKYDMSEFGEKHTVATLIGSPPGYVGFGEGGTGGGKLVNDIDANPYCVLLLDEMEKAHPDVFNILLQVMDDGKLTSLTGKTVSFRNVVLIMTSNAGAKDAQRNRIGFGSQDNKDGDIGKINDLFSPEFRNRLDAVVRFDRLKPEHIALIVDKFLAGLSEMAAARNVTFDIDAASKDWLAKKGFDPLMGARPLKRVIQENISVPLARLMVIGSLADHGGVATVRVVDDKLVVT